jgi:hypothetical protein
MAQYTTGVKGGDWIKYNFKISVSYEGTIKVTIQEVTDTDITGTTEYANFPGMPSGSTPFSLWTTTLKIKAAETNMFSPGFDWLFWIIIIAVVVVVAVIAVIIVRRVRKPPMAPPTAEQPPPPLPAPES